MRVFGVKYTLILIYNLACQVRGQIISEITVFEYDDDDILGEPLREPKGEFVVLVIGYIYIYGGVLDNDCRIF